MTKNKQVEGFDFANIKSKSAELKIMHPGTGDFTGLVLTVIGTGSDPMKKVIAEIDKQRQKLLMRRKQFTTEQVDENQMRLYIASVIDWNWGFDDEGNQSHFRHEQPEFSKKAFRELLVEAPFIKTQLDEMLSVDGNFFPG